MSKIKVYVRVRPPLPGEFDQPGCFNCTEMEDVSGNWIQIKKEGEAKRYFARVWGPGSSQDDMFRTIGINTVCDVFEGFYGCIFVYGQTGTGKTFTLGCLTPGLEGIQPQCLRFLFEKIQKENSKYEVTVQQQYVQLYRDAVQDLIDITKDNLKVRVDEASGAIIEKVTTRDVKTYEESIDMIKEGDGNRAVANTKMNSASSRSHACCIVEVTRKERSTGKQTFGRLYLIDLAGSERVSKSGVTDDAFKEAVAINKSLTTLGNCIAAIVNKEKTVSFRDSPLTRILQHSLSGHGRTSIIITIRPDSPNMQETICTIRFGERAQKVEAQMTPASYLEQFLEGINKVTAVERSLSEAESNIILCRSWASEVKKSIGSKEAESSEKEKESISMIEKLSKEIEEVKTALTTKLEAYKQEKDAETNSQVEDLRIANASVIEEIDRKVSEAEAIAREKMSLQMKPVLSEMDAFRKEEERLRLDVDKGKEEASAYIDPSVRTRELISQIEDKIKVVHRKIKGCKPSKNEGLSLFDLRTKEAMLKEAIQKMEVRKVALIEKRLQGWDQAKMSRMFKRPEREEMLKYLEMSSGEDAYRGLLDEVQEDTPPPDEAPPSTDSDSTESTQTSSYDSSDNSDTDSDSSDESYSDASDADGAARDQIEQLQQGLTRLDGKPIPNRPAERKQLDMSMEKDSQLGSVLNDIIRFVDMGSIVYLVDPPLQKGGVPVITKRYMFMHDCEPILTSMRSEPRDPSLTHLPLDPRLPKGPTLCISSPLNPKLSEVVDRRDVDVVIKIKDIGRIIVGQYSKTWLDSIEGAPMLPPGTDVPKDCSKISPTTLPAFLSRSISLMGNTGGHNVLADIVFNEDADIESWLITLHRSLRKEPQYGRLMDLTGHLGVDELNDNEKAYCSLNHMLPTRLKSIMSKVKENDSPRLLYFTMLDLRRISNLDLLQTQRLFEFLFLEGMFDRVTNFYIRYDESVKVEDEELEKQKEIRNIRIRIIAMLRHYRNLSVDATQSILLECVGKEANLLQMLINQFGAEPPSEEETADRDARRHQRAQILALLRYFHPELGTAACRQRIIEISVEQSEEKILKELKANHTAKFIPTEEMIIEAEKTYYGKRMGELARGELGARVEIEKEYVTSVGELSILLAEAPTPEVAVSSTESPIQEAPGSVAETKDEPQAQSEIVQQDGNREVVKRELEPESEKVAAAPEAMQKENAHGEENAAGKEAGKEAGEDEEGEGEEGEEAEEYEEYEEVQVEGEEEEETQAE